MLEIEQGRIVEFTFFLGTETIFPVFGLPAPGVVASVGQCVAQAHEQLGHLARRMVQPDLTAVAPGGNP